VADGDIYQEIDLISQPDVADFEIGAATTLAREHLLAPGGKTCVIINALERLQDVLVRSGPISAVIDARIDVVPSTVTAH
jgi:hypothetical protein